MNTRIACLLVAGATACAQAQEVRLTDKVVLICPDRSPRMTDIDLAVKAVCTPPRP